jgi:hypothetical protein
VNDEYISRVQVGTINNASGAQFDSDFAKQFQQISNRRPIVYINYANLDGNYGEGHAWIDYNHDGDFTDAESKLSSRFRVRQ